MNDNLPQADGQNSTNVNNFETVTSAHEDLHNEIAEASESTNINDEVVLSKDYDNLSMEELVDELTTLVSNDRINLVKNAVEDLKKSFLAKYHNFIEEKRNEFFAQNEESAEFEYHSPLKVKFDHLFDSYRNKRNLLYNQLQNQLKQNLNARNQLIDELKVLIDSNDGNFSEMFKKFNIIRENWKKTGAIPKDKYNLVWNNYHFHVDRFYELVHLDKEIREADFKNNLEQKLQLIEKAKNLLQLENINQAFRELQLLHRVWKEEIGPVDTQYREQIWTDFSAVTKQLLDKKEELAESFRALETENATKKSVIISQINELAGVKVNAHSDWQNQIKKLEELREQFLKTGKVPLEQNENIWSSFKNAVRNFNAVKNSFYKEIKNEQQHNLEQKLALIEKAKTHASSNDFDAVTPILKQIQEDWKKIGHVPRKNSDEIWKEFKEICNGYFDRLHDSRKEEIEKEVEAFEKKKTYLEELKNFSLSGEHKTDLEAIKAHIASWKEIGRVPQNRRHIEAKFNKVLDHLFEQLSLSKKDSELMKFNNKLEQLSDSNNERAIINEQIFIRRKIDELQAEIFQLENNIQFISNAKADNPLVKEVHKSIDRNKDELNIWKEKLKKLRAIN